MFIIDLCLYLREKSVLENSHNYKHVGVPMLNHSKAVQ